MQCQVGLDTSCLHQNTTNRTSYVTKSPIAMSCQIVRPDRDVTEIALRHLILALVQSIRSRSGSKHSHQNPCSSKEVRKCSIILKYNIALSRLFKLGGAIFKKKLNCGYLTNYLSTTSSPSELRI